MAPKLLNKIEAIAIFAHAPSERSLYITISFNNRNYRYLVEHKMINEREEYFIIKAKTKRL